MDEPAQSFSWRKRGAALAVSALVVALTCFLLYLVSRHDALEDGSRTAGVEVLLQPKPPEHPRATPHPQSARAAPLPSPLAPARSGDPVLAQMLVCFGSHRREHPECARAAAEPNAPEIAIGSHSDRDVAPNLRNVYSPGELMTIAPEAKCAVLNSAAAAKVCMPTYPDPPPPSRTAEEICVQQNMGGPCHPPIPDVPQHVRRTPSTPP